MYGERLPPTEGGGRINAAKSTASREIVSLAKEIFRLRKREPRSVRKREIRTKTPEKSTSFSVLFLNEGEELGVHGRDVHEERLDGGVVGNGSPSRLVTFHPIHENLQLAAKRRHKFVHFLHSSILVSLKEVLARDRQLRLSKVTPRKLGADSNSSFEYRARERRRNLKRESRDLTSLDFIGNPVALATVVGAEG